VIGPLLVAFGGNFQKKGPVVTGPFFHTPLPGHGFTVTQRLRGLTLLRERAPLLREMSAPLLLREL